MSDKTSISHEGKQLRCMKDGIAFPDQFGRSPIRVIFVLKQPKETTHDLLTGVREKAEDIEKGKPGQKNLWQNCIRWAFALQSKAESGRWPAWSEIANARGPSRPLADALRSCAFFNLDDTCEEGPKRNMTIERQFTEMARTRRGHQWPRIVEAANLMPRRKTVVLCGGKSTFRLCREYAMQQPLVIRLHDDECAESISNSVTFVGMWHPSAYKKPQVMYEDLKQRCRDLF